MNNTPQDIQNLTQSIGYELENLGNPNYGHSDVSSLGGFSFLENPSANHAESYSAGMETPNPTMFQSLDPEMDKYVKRHMEEELRVKREQQARHFGPDANHSVPRPPPFAPTQSAPVAPSSPVLEIPENFDFDLFHHAVLKDMFDQLSASIAVLEKHKNTIEKALKGCQKKTK